LNRLFMELLIYFICRELAFCGHDESSTSLNKVNFMELFYMHINM